MTTRLHAKYDVVAPEYYKGLSIFYCSSGHQPHHGVAWEPRDGECQTNPGQRNTNNWGQRTGTVRNVNILTPLVLSSYPHFHILVSLSNWYFTTIAVISQSDWLMRRGKWESRQRCWRQHVTLEKINQSHCLLFLLLHAL
jgi:hypothetical protein